MKTTNQIRGVAILGVALLVAGCGQKQKVTFQSFKTPEVAAQLKSFVVKKEAQADVAAKAEGKSVAPQFKPFFTAAEKGDWLTISNLFQELAPRTGQIESHGMDDLMDLRGIQWEALKEIWGAFDNFSEGKEKYSVTFGYDIIKVIPPGSVYFGGTDRGRFVVTALQKSQVDGNPFFTLTQNALADGTYLDYLRSMYGTKIYIPSSEDSQRCFQDYTDDAQLRLKQNKLKPG